MAEDLHYPISKYIFFILLHELVVQSCVHVLPDIYKISVQLLKEGGETLQSKT
jgi:hypothetical protein